MTSIEALLQVPGTQLQTIEATLRQLYKDLQEANLPIPDDLEVLIGDAAEAKVELAAYKEADPPYTNEPYYDPCEDIKELSLEDRLTLLSYTVSSDFHYHRIVRTDIDREYVELEEAYKKLHPSVYPTLSDEEYELPF